MRAVITRLVIASLIFLSLIGAALAADSIIIPVGDWFGAALPVVAFIVLVLLGIAIAWGLKLAPPWLQALATPAIQAQLLVYAANALNTAVQGVREATKDKVLTIPVGNSVIAAAVQEAVDTWPKKIVDKLGGPAGVAKFLLQQAEDHHVILDASTTTADILNSPAVQAVLRANPQ